MHTKLPNCFSTSTSLFDTESSFDLLFDDTYRNGFAINGTGEYDVAPDGRFLMMRSGDSTDPNADPDQYDHFVLVDNWFDELRRLVPED